MFNQKRKEKKMKYYIERPQTWAPANRKCRELQEFVKRYTHCIIDSDAALDALQEELAHAVLEANARHPKTKPVGLYKEDDRLSCHAEESREDLPYVFVIKIHPVRRVYRFAEGNNLLEEGK
jgi:hypothetical protein